MPAADIHHETAVVIRILEKGTLQVFRRIEAVFNTVFGESWNPWYQLGALSFYFYWIVAATGLYLFIFFNTSIIGAYVSVEKLTVGQWYFGGVLRSFHRYASDAMAITVTLHIVREFGLGRFRGARWFSWFSGVPLLWLLFASAIGGYWLVWDQLAQYIAVATSEWLDWLPIFTDPLARNFLSDLTLSDRLFSLLVFMHIALPLFLLLGMFIHIKRMKLAHTNPPRGLAVGVLLALLLLSVIKPAVSMAPADLSVTVARVDIDWIYMNVYPLLDTWGPGGVWLLLLGVTMVLAVLPWLSPERREQRLDVAVVDPANCNGCSWCFQDCPHEAIVMVDHEYKSGHRQAQVDPDLCTGCGICAGSCPSATPFRHVDELVSGIEIPSFSIDHLRSEAEQKAAALSGDSKVVVFGCDHALDVNRVEAPGVAAISLPCTGLLPPSLADYMARRDNVDGVLVSGCSGGDCYFRKGSKWTEQRFSNERMPHLRTKAGQDKVRLYWAAAYEDKKLLLALEEFRAELAPHGPVDSDTEAAEHG